MSVNPEQVIFAVAGGISVVAAANAVLRSEPLVSALSLVVALFGLAVIYLALGAEFLAFVQIAVYAGAIVVLFVFVIMLLGASGARVPKVAGAPRLAMIGPVVAVALFAVLATAILRSSGRAELELSGTQADQIPDHIGAVADTLFVRFLLPFEIVSVLLLAALISAVLLARKRSTEREWPGRR